MFAPPGELAQGRASLMPESSFTIPSAPAGPVGARRRAEYGLPVPRIEAPRPPAESLARLIGAAALPPHPSANGRGPWSAIRSLLFRGASISSNPREDVSRHPVPARPVPEAVAEQATAQQCAPSEIATSEMPIVATFVVSSETASDADRERTRSTTAADQAACARSAESSAVVASVRDEEPLSEVPRVPEQDAASLIAEPVNSVRTVGIVGRRESERRALRIAQMVARVRSSGRIARLWVGASESYRGSRSPGLESLPFCLRSVQSAGLSTVARALGHAAIQSLIASVGSAGAGAAVDLAPAYQKPGTVLRAGWSKYRTVSEGALTMAGTGAFRIVGRSSRARRLP